MGCFTWTFADKRGRYLGYGRRGYLMCPNNKHIKETNYEGYGIFSGKDVYELVVDWNRSLLKKIYERLPQRYELDRKEFQIAMAAMESDEAAELKAQELFSNGPMVFRKEWKRNIGITISFFFERNPEFKGFKPIKIVSTASPKNRYDQLPYSKLTQ